MTRLLLSFVLAGALSALGCGGQCPEPQTGPTQGPARDAPGPQAAPLPDDPQTREAVALLERTGAQHDELLAAHEAAWRQRLELTTGVADVNALEPRLVDATTDMNGRSQQARAALHGAMQAARHGHLDVFRSAINAALLQIRAMRLMVERIQEEVRRLSPTPPADTSGDASAAP